MSGDLTNRVSGNDDSRLDQIISMLGSIDSRVQVLEQRQYDTKPVWERALAEIIETRAEMRERFAAFESEMREGFKALNREIKQTNRLIRTLSDNSLKMQSGVRDLDDRVGDLETKAT